MGGRCLNCHITKAVIYKNNKHGNATRKGKMPVKAAAKPKKPAATKKKPSVTKPPMTQKEPFAPGDRVFVRWFGDDLLTVVREHKCSSPFPHYVCRFEETETDFVVSKLQMSRKRITMMSGDANRKQLELPVDTWNAFPHAASAASSSN
jgi:hypothetical protein